MQLIGLWALIAATIGPVQNVLGWSISGYLIEGYDPISKTISDLAADDSPVKWIQSSFFLAGAILTIIAAYSSKSLAFPGRVALFLAGFAGFGYTYFPTASEPQSPNWHVIFATIAFVLFSAWPLLSMRFDRRYHWTLRPVAAISATSIMGVTTLWFLLTWLEPGQPIVGLSERVIAVMQVLWLSFVIWSQWLHQQKTVIKYAPVLDRESKS